MFKFVLLKIIIQVSIPLQFAIFPSNVFVDREFLGFRIPGTQSKNINFFLWQFL